MQQSVLTIARLAAEFGLSLRTLRFYEQRGLLKPARVGQTRLYSQRDRIRLQIIIKGKRLGLSIAEIDRLITSATHEEEDYDLTNGMSTSDLEEKLISIDEQIAQLQEASKQLMAALAERRREMVA